jgi:hypothetical protein
LLGSAATATFGLLVGADQAFAQSTQPSSSPVSTPRRISPPWWIQQHQSRSRVVDIRSNSVVQGSAVDHVGLGEMLDQAIRSLTGQATEEAGWRRVLGAAERIVLKFNAVGARVIDTNEVMARLLVERIAAAGYEPQNLVLVEVPSYLRRELGTGEITPGWGAPVSVGGRLEPLARYLHESDAIVNVPLLKTHQIAGMSGCMKNLSHALVRHPAWYHANGCSPYVGQVIGSQAVSARVKLNLVNAVRVVVNGGPDARGEDIVGYGGLLLGFDPVAVDTLGLGILATERRRLGLAGGGQVRYLASAAGMGIGRWRPVEIDRITLQTDG